MGALATVTALALAGALEPASRATPRAAAPASANAAAVATEVSPGIGAVITAVGTSAERRGSGIVVGAHELLTTGDVVAAAALGASVRVAVGDGHTWPATVRAVDTVTNLALLDVPGKRLRPAQLTGAAPVRAGDWIVVVGRTATNGPWVSSGVVTATGGWVRDADGTPHPGLIATNTELTDDARGGALVDGSGHIVGILATVSAGTERAAAMPADMADDVATQLAASGHASHGALGVRATDTDAGPVIAAIEPGSCAARAGLHVDDRIVAIDGTPTPDTATLVYELRRREAGARTVITYQRGHRSARTGIALDDAATTTTTATGGMAPLSLSVTGG